MFRTLHNQPLADGKDMDRQCEKQANTLATLTWSLIWLQWLLRPVLSLVYCSAGAVPQRSECGSSQCLMSWKLWEAVCSCWWTHLLCCTTQTQSCNSLKLSSLSWSTAVSACMQMCAQYIVLLFTSDSICLSFCLLLFSSHRCPFSVSFNKRRPQYSLSSNCNSYIIH